MAEIIRMPKLSDTMTEGVIAEWHKKIGDQVVTGELLAEIETDKATMEFESYYDGTLLYIGIKKGDSAPVNDILVIIGEKGESVDALLVAEKKNKSTAQKPIIEKKSVQEQKIIELIEEKSIELPLKNISSKPVSANTESDNGRVKISPIAKKLALERGIDVTRVHGSGENGRIVKRDINFFGAQNMVLGQRTEHATDYPVSQMRKTIAKRLSESKFTAPHFYLTIEMKMDAMITARKGINDVTSVKISYNDLVIKAVAEALKKHPKVNSSWLGDKIRTFDHIHIGVAVAVEDGLLVPVIRFADTLRLTEIATMVKAFSKKASSKKLQPEDWQGNTFTISNLGMFGIEDFTAIINSPDACIMAVGGIKSVPIVENGQVVAGNVMKVTLSCDHRVFDGVTGAKFLQTFKMLMENPAILLGSDNI